MNIHLRNRRRGKRTIDLRWLAALAFAAVLPVGGIALASSEQEDDEGTDAERRAALVQQADASDRHLQTLADAAEARARELQAQGSDQHLRDPRRGRGGAGP